MPHPKWFLSGSWVFGSLPRTMKFCSAYTVDHCTYTTQLNSQIDLLPLALFLGLLSVYSLCCKKKGNNWIASVPVSWENLERRAGGRNWVIKHVPPKYKASLKKMGQNQNPIACICQKQWKQTLPEWCWCPDCSLTHQAAHSKFFFSAKLGREAQEHKTPPE